MKNFKTISNEKIALIAGFLLGCLVLVLALVFRSKLPENFVIVSFFTPLFTTLILGIALEVLFKATTGKSRKRGVTMNEVRSMFGDAKTSFELYKIISVILVLGASYCSVAFLMALVLI